MLLAATIAAILTGCGGQDEGGTVEADLAPIDPARLSRAPANPPVALSARHILITERVRLRHILISYHGARIRPRGDRNRDEARLLASRLREKIVSGEDMAALARTFSDDADTMAVGGMLGTFPRYGKGLLIGDAFEETAFRLKVGEVSEIVETPPGFHVIRRENSR